MNVLSNNDITSIKIEEGHQGYVLTEWYPKQEENDYNYRHYYFSNWSDLLKWLMSISGHDTITKD